MAHTKRIWRGEAASCTHAARQASLARSRASSAAAAKYAWHATRNKYSRVNDKSLLKLSADNPGHTPALAYKQQLPLTSLYNTHCKDNHPTQQATTTRLSSCVARDSHEAQAGHALAVTCGQACLPVTPNGSRWQAWKSMRG
eukprot:scaffold122647_cov16-Tisochrysis_lutea.AAC.2